MSDTAFQKCNKCGKTKEIVEFRIRSDNGKPRRECKLCSKSFRLEWEHSYDKKIKKACTICGSKIYYRNKSGKCKRCARLGITNSEQSNRLRALAVMDGKNANWKGNSAGIYAKHKWMYTHYGQPILCDHCENKNNKRMEWANISGLYKRERYDWLRLCSRCHYKFDYKVKRVFRFWMSLFWNADYHDVLIKTFT